MGQDSERVELDDGPLRTPVTDRVAAPSLPNPDLLPFHQRSWQDFEKIILVVAEHIDGMRGVRIYGTPGQAQLGIDLYGTNVDGDNVGYQSKRVVSFDVRDLVAAVEKFDAEQRAVRAKKLVISVACETDPTQMSEKLEELRRTHPAFEIDLYDCRRLSESLKSRPDLVRRLFGDAWAATFCDGVDWPVPEPARSDVIAAALIRGPVSALQLDDSLNHCRELVSSDPAAAAAGLGEIIDKLASEGFGGITGQLQAQRAELLVTGGDSETACDLLSAQVWEHIESGGVHWDRTALGRLKALAGSNDLPHATTFVAFADAVDDWYSQPGRDLSLVLQRLHELSESGHPLTRRATIWTVETAIAFRDSVAAALILPAVAAIIEGGGRRLDDPTAVRLRTARADIDGNWDGLLRDARAGRLGSSMATLVHARFGRYLTRLEQPEDAEVAFSAAIQTACTGDLSVEAAAAVRSIVEVRTRFGPLRDDVNALLRMAFDIESSGSGGLIPGRDPLDAGTASLSANRLPDALRWYKTALRGAVIRGDLTDERRAQDALVDILAQAGERRPALQIALAAGSSDGVGKSAPLAEYFDPASWLQNGPYWERAAALHLLAVESDLVPDDAVAQYVDLALAATQETRRGLFDPHVDLAAWKMLAAFSERLTLEQSVRALDLLAPAIPREPTHYRYEDDEHVEIVVGVARSHPDLRRRTADHLARIVGQGDGFAETARRQVVTRLNPASEELVGSLTAMADDGSEAALLVLGDLGVQHPSLVEAVRAAVQQFLAAPAPPPGTFFLGTALPQLAYRARVLDEDDRRLLAAHCITVAEDPNMPEISRTEGVLGVLVLAKDLPDDVRQQYFRRILTVFRSDDAHSEFDRSLAGGLHPLSVMRIDLDRGSLRRDALRAAATLASTAEDATEVASLANELLISRDDKDVYAAAAAISYLEPEQVRVDVPLLAAHPVNWVRQLAAVVAAHRPETNGDILLSLARDRDPSVRRSLASGVSTIAKHDDSLAQRITALLLADAHWSVRHLTAVGTPSDL